MLTAMAASSKLKTLETALSPPCPINPAILWLSRKITQVITIFRMKDIRTQ